MLNYTVVCITHFFYILQFTECPFPKLDLFLSKSPRQNAWVLCVFQLFHQCLSAQRWAVGPGHAVGPVLKLAASTLQLLLPRPQRGPLSSERLLACFHFLRMVADHLNGTYYLQPEVISASNQDSLVVPIFQILQDSRSRENWAWCSSLKTPPQAVNLVQQPGHRYNFFYIRVLSALQVFSFLKKLSCNSHTINVTVLKFIKSVIFSSDFATRLKNY